MNVTPFAPPTDLLRGTMPSNSEIVPSVWLRIVGEPFEPRELARQVRHDGGLDAQGVTDEMVLQLIDGTYNGDWTGKGDIHIYRKTILESRPNVTLIIDPFPFSDVYV